MALEFVESELSFASLHKTLNQSPLIEKIEHSLYKLRGNKITHIDISRARLASDHVPTDLVINYDTKGNILISINVGVIVVGAGTVFSESLPNIEGEWECFHSNNICGSITVTENEIRNLKKPFEFIECKPGHRIQLIFNLWKRTVEIKKIDYEN